MSFIHQGNTSALSSGRYWTKLVFTNKTLFPIIHLTVVIITCVYLYIYNPRRLMTSLISPFTICSCNSLISPRWSLKSGLLIRALNAVDLECVSPLVWGHEAVVLGRHLAGQSLLAVIWLAACYHHVQTCREREKGEMCAFDLHNWTSSVSHVCPHAYTLDIDDCAISQNLRV